MLFVCFTSHGGETYLERDQNRDRSKSTNKGPEKTGKTNEKQKETYFATEVHEVTVGAKMDLP